VQSQDRPNIVLIFPDNLGFGEVSSFGSARGITTPNIDRIGAEGIRLTNFNVEYSCTVSRIAILTGRYAVRSGFGNARNGMTLWENTIAENLRSVGYATALFGKWHVGGEHWHGKREPTDQGFDEWYGIPNSSHPSQFTSFEGYESTGREIPYIWEGREGEDGKKVKPFNLESRRTIDREAALRGVDFMKENANRNKPFFLYYPMTQIHFPTLTHPDKIGSTGAGDVADAMSDVDHNVGLLLAEIERLGIEENTLVIWCTDNGGEMRRPWRGNSGPWRGYYNSAMEGGIRTPFVAKWPKRIKPGQVSNALFHEIDILPTLMAAAGVTDHQVEDRIIDGVDQLSFLEDAQTKSNRNSTLFVAREGHIMAVKWHHWKLWYYFKTNIELESKNFVRLFDLQVDPQEQVDVKDFYPWVIPIMDSIVADYEASLIEFPRVPFYVDDPYSPPARNSGNVVKTYERSDRIKHKERSKAIPDPDFSGAWTSDPVAIKAPKKGAIPEAIPDLGSGWGNQIMIQHANNYLSVERILFDSREVQPPILYRYNLSGSESRNIINMGRTWPASVSKTLWEDNRLVIETEYTFKNPSNSKWEKAKMIQTMWLQAGTKTPWMPTLVIESKRVGVMGGITSTNWTVYTKGYY